MTHNRILLCSSAVFLLAISLSQAQSPAEFSDPSRDYHPKTWMHAMNGNLGREGFDKDFEALADAGIGGAILFHVDRGLTPKGPVSFGSEKFIDTLVHAVGAAEEAGIEMGLHNCDGWSSSGGPWITPELSMKRITWLEETVPGDRLWRPGVPLHLHGFYRDIAVLAWPATVYDREDAFETMRLSSSVDADPAVLLDNDWDNGLELEPDGQGLIWIQIDLEEPGKLHALQIEAKGHRSCQGELQVSSDGKSFRTVETLSSNMIANTKTWSYSPSFEAVEAKHFRITFSIPVAVHRLELWPSPRAKGWIPSTSMARGTPNLLPTVPGDAIINREDLVVLNRGTLPGEGIQIPKGIWRVVRFGYTTTGATNTPASSTGHGLECDKLDKETFRFHFEQYVGKVARAAAERGYTGLKFSEIDSYEVGGQNWTEDLDRAFESRYGYDFIPWLPLVTGRVVESPEHSGAVLQEFRKLIADLMAENYFGAFTELCHQYGMESYIEPYGIGPFDELKTGGMADRTMGEFWVREGPYRGRLPSAVSSARIYGKEIISAEAYTSLPELNWRGYPYHFKQFGDHVWSQGINEMMFHRYAHQPNTHVVPGATMDRIGSHIDRTQTWWSNGGVAWFNYLARGSYLLRQGVPESEFLVHLGDVSPIGIPNPNFTNVPHGFNYDYCNSDVLINRIHVSDGWLVLPEGTRYRALYLHDSEHLEVETVQRIRELIEQGATIIGRKPLAPIGYSQWKYREAFNEAVAAVWGDGEEAIRSVGKGKVCTLPIGQAVESLSYEEDLRIDGTPVEFFSHRRIGKNDLYYFYNRSPEFMDVEVDIRDGDGQPELWDVDTGKVEPLTHYTRKGKRLLASMRLEPHAVRFVLIRRDGELPLYNGGLSALLDAVYGKKGKELQGSWVADFDPAWGGPGTVILDELIDWTRHAETGIRHYSGTVRYTKEIELTPGQADSGSPVYLDLGDVLYVAEVTVNGSKLATLWKPPFALDVSQALQAGKNVIEVEITNTWTNRLIGDEALEDTSGYSLEGDMVEWFANNEPPPESDRVTFTTYNFYENEVDRVLQPSGLIGPVRLIESSWTER
ncbi:MAG: glycosyl hydrolase [Puniceicoccaceae bacterium]